MKQIFKGEVYEILPLPNGIIFSYCKEVIDNEVVVSYKMITFENGKFSDIAKNIYLLTKFGNNYKSVVNHCENYITVKSLVLPSGKVFLLFPDGTAKLIDTDSTVVWQGNFTYRSQTPSDIILHKNSLWASFPEYNALVRYSLNTMKEELRIGGNKSPFKKPKSMFLDGDSVIIANQESQKLTQVNLENYIVLELEEFDEPLFQYVRSDIYRFVILKSGLYML